MEIWDSYAVFQRSGTRYGHCIFDGPASSSSDIWIKWKERINEGAGGDYKDTYGIKLVLSQAMTDLVVNLTLSIAPKKIEGKKYSNIKLYFFITYLY